MSTRICPLGIHTNRPDFSGRITNFSAPLKNHIPEFKALLSKFQFPTMAAAS